jgi:hypothetical protein
MRKLVQVAAVVSVGFGLMGLSALEAGGRRGQPAPPPPVLCGCACSDGSFVIVHAPDEASCPSVCATACPSES